MKKVLKIVLFCAFVFGSLSTSAQTLEEYLGAESVRISQAQSTETAVESFVQSNYPGYSLSPADINTVTTTLQQEGTTTQANIDSGLAATKRSKLRGLYFSQNPGAGLYYQAGLPSVPLMQTCVNGDFEAGPQNYTFNSVQNLAMTACNTPPAANAPVIAGINNFNGMATLISRNELGFQLNDPTLATLGVQVPTLPAGSNRCIKLNNNAAQDFSVTTMTRTFIVNNPLLEYQFSIVMQNPGHPPGQNPFFRVSIIAGGQRTTLRCINAVPDCIFQLTQNQAMLFSGWRCDQLNVAAFVGQLVTLEFTVGDCSQGAHFGTVYIDNICGFTCNNPSFGFLQINPLNTDCTQLVNNVPYQICGSFTPPVNANLTGLLVDISKNGGAFVPILNGTLQQNANNTFCFTFPVSNFGQFDNGDTYQFRVTANYMQNCNTIVANSSNTAFASVTFTNCCIDVLTLVSGGVDDVSNISTPVSFTNRQRSNWIKAANKINFGNNLLNNGVVYHAGNFIELNPGFEAVFTSQFKAYIEGCSGAYSYRSSNNFISQTNPSISSEDFAHNLNPVLIYPNPSSRYVNIVTSKIKFNRITIANLSGRVLFNAKFESANKHFVNIGNLPGGVYIASILCDDGTFFSRKFIKN